ncbi:hypothetical protein [Clostridium perfringens]|uniref:hypothetical protein n=1 Tax=Clostridium perfringens TaxID=1502 RepID=UPI0008A69637|nr:hypothetical protein [Clostridium perfringens]AOY54879.1 hypothetical protein FORC25_2467 [Clostridium perfringens]MDK0597665.1 hypothetical protein [Clostridium perfringens]MDK0683254.1 hypothetical protein [Clostridium perfringens]MDK0857950.1 hypothetical protein [Clostridium perfringens]MDM0549701.1 hypothetical protein [Clostridium perfringens]
MVHTAEFYIIITEEEANKILFQISGINILRFDFGNIILKKISLGSKIEWRLLVYVDFIIMLGKTDILESDINDVINKVNAKVYNILNRNYELVLYRLDYRYDAIIESSKERDVLIKLFNKNKIRVNYMRKIKKYKSSVRYYSKSRSDNIYDKEAERIAKKKEVKYFEKNVIRFEAQIKHEHLRYNKKKYGIAMKLQEYFTFEKYVKYMDKMIVSVLKTGDYYNLYNASKIIKNFDINEKDKKILIEFLKFTSLKRSLTASYEKFGRYKYEKCINLLSIMDINPIIIPEKDRISFIKNPLKNLINQEFYKNKRSQ